jgi:flavorubredoxin
MIDFLIEALMDRGVTVKRFELSSSDIGKLAMSLVDAATIVIGTPTVLAGPHPLAAYAAFLANALRPTIKYVSIIGSYSWGGKAVETLAGMIPNLKAEVIEPVYCKGVPREADFQALVKLAETIAVKHKQSNFI